MRELIPAQVFFFPGLVFQLPLQYPGGGQGRHAHTVSQEQYHILSYSRDLIQIQRFL